ncbi:hypothetical protein F5984_01125 [Rudanella paleaurantiibacter]|uniref:Sigma-70 family RNA polymerase sigma factor n=1 Tax=Rudanella paleaurantiibacter TaxID=2614655 RepID=A0A7J5U418_9BACT|nr:hypothetical protein [Rudanella paleaurantiibacter]KAB7732588.1 hypothetical protein F5984_01125 [Rudanella paleaurantiibacter]
MNEWERATPSVITKPTEQLALYDRYGSIAYGVILQILPQAPQAQEVMLDLFTSTDLLKVPNPTGNMALTIIRLARAKALEAKSRLGVPLPSTVDPDTAKANLPDTVFNLSFRQGYSIEAIAEKLQLTKAEVLKAIHDYSIAFRQA